jgi:septum site-determining protein MinD
VKLIGVVPEDDSVIVGSNRGTPVALDPKSRAGQAFRNIARRLQGQDVPFMDLEAQAGLWGALQKLGRK